MGHCLFLKSTSGIGLFYNRQGHLKDNDRGHCQCNEGLTKKHHVLKFIVPILYTLARLSLYGKAAPLSTSTQI